MPPVATPESITGKERADLGVFQLRGHVRMDTVNEEDRTVEISFSSEAEVERWFGIEILDHSPDSVRLERILSGGPLLWQHDRDALIGVVEQVSLGADRVGRAVVRFGGSQLAEEKFQDVKSGVIQNVSVGYAVHGMILEKEEDGMEPVYRVNDWEILEISFVSIPADISVGVGRSEDFLGAAVETRIHQPQARQKPQERNMPPEPDPTPPPPIDLKAERAKWQAEQKQKDESRKREREDMSALAEQHKEKVPGAVELASKYMAEGRSLDELKSAFLERHKDAKPVDTSAGLLGMDEKEMKRWKFSNVVAALTRPQDRRAQDGASFEREVSEEYGKKVGREFAGFGLPLDVMTFTGRFGRQALERLSRRDLVIGTASAGGNLKGTELLGASFIDVLRAANPITGDATLLTGLTGDIAIPRHSAATTPYWVGEGVAPTEGAPTFDQITAAPKTLGAYLDISRKLRLQSSIDIEEFSFMDLATSLGIEIGRVIAEGSGSGAEPTGILNTSGIGDVAGGTNGLAPTWAHISNIKKEVAKDNALRGEARWYLNPDTIGKLEQTERWSGSGYPLLDLDRGGNTMGGYGYRESGLVPNDLTKGSGTDLSAILFAVMSDALVPMWSGIDITVDEASLSTVGALRIVALQDLDVMVRHVQSFSAMQDAITV